MNCKSRTSQSVKNSIVALVYYFVNLIIQFFSRKIFISYLGAEVLGLNTTIVNLLQFLNLAELGIGAAVAYSLYKPIASKNYQEVCDIVSVQGYLYRKIGIFVCLASAVLICFFPLIFAKAQVQTWYSYATFVVLLVAALAGYFFNYRQILFTADQKEYKLTYVIQTFKAVKSILQIFSILYLSDGYVWWLLLEFIFTIFTVLGINYILSREYPWLKTNLKIGKYLCKKYPQIVIKTKQLFFHKIGGFVLSQTSPLIIYAYTSLTIVAIYGNYMLILSGVSALLNAVFNSVNAGVGNLVAEGDEIKIMKVFHELFSTRFLFVSTICFEVYMLTDSFIVLWLGKEYLLDRVSLVLIISILYITTMRTVIDSYIYAFGLFHDIWAPIVEALLNLILSISLGYFWGLHGILCGVVISLLLMVFGWKPYLVFKYGFQRSIWLYVVMYGKHIIAMLVAYFISYYMINLLGFVPSKSIGMFCFSGLIYFVIYFSFLILILYVTFSGMKDFVKRIMSIIKL